MTSTTDCDTISLEVLQLADLEPPRQGRFAVKKERGKSEGDDVEDRAEQE